MITFAESHVDLLGSIVFTQRQLVIRWDEELGKKWGTLVQDNLRDFMQIKDAVDPVTFPGYAQNLALLGAFITDKQECYSRRVADESKNTLLKAALTHEQAVRDVAALTLLINGRTAVAEVPEVLDPETGEVTQSYVPAVSAVEPLDIDSAVYADADGELVSANLIISTASQEVLELVALRAAQ